MTIRLPRLAAAKAERILAARGLLQLDELECIGLPDLETEQFAPTGPARVTADYLQSVRSAARQSRRQLTIPTVRKWAFACSIVMPPSTWEGLTCPLARRSVRIHGAG